MSQARPKPSVPAPGPNSGRPEGRLSEPAISPFFLGRYRVVDELGVGGMARVYLGRMDGPGGFQKWVAIKRIHSHLVEDDVFVDMFLDEARIVAGINHPNVAQVFDLGKHESTYWIAMEYLHGEPLREVMRCKERLPSELAAKICADAAEGIHAAHELRGKNGQPLNLVHRDITPHNLFVTYDGYTKVVDFGVAKAADRLASTRAGALKGKIAYMSPEQLRGGEVDRTTDVFALGIVLWELLTDQRLFRMEGDLETLEKVQACEIPPPTSIDPTIPKELEAIVMKALARQKADRFPTAREFARALSGFLMGKRAVVGPAEISAYLHRVFAERVRKRDDHLAWASEVTSDGEAITSKSAREDATDEEDTARELARSSLHPEPEPQALDDDELPTLIATREQADELGRVMPSVPSSGSSFPRSSSAASTPRSVPTVPPMGGASHSQREPSPPARAPSEATRSSAKIQSQTLRTQQPKGSRSNVRSLVFAVLMFVVGMSATLWFMLRADAVPGDSAPQGSAAEATPTAVAVSSKRIEPKPDRPSGSSSKASEAERSASLGPVGFLELTCVPGCETVSEGDTVLGKAPLEKVPFAPGAHRLTLKNGDVTKFISVFVASNEVTTQRVVMQP